MSAAMVSASTSYEFGDLLYKNNLQCLSKLQIQTGDTKAVGSPLSVSGLQQQPLSRRNSNPVSVGSSTLLATKFSSMMESGIMQHRKLDRSHSEPVERATAAAMSAAAAAKANVNTSRYKTELCRPYEESGSCKYGDKCQFAHGGHELRTLVRHPKYKTELCRTFHTIGFCPYGPRCHFIHNAEEARNNKVSAAIPTTSMRPKQLNLGSAFSLGSGGESPPSSLSESPTSMGSFFTDDIFTPSPFSPSPVTPVTPAANTAFTFGQDFASFVRRDRYQGGRMSVSPPGTPPGQSSPPPTSSGSVSPTLVPNNKVFGLVDSNAVMDQSVPTVATISSELKGLAINNNNNNNNNINNNSRNNNNNGSTSPEPPTGSPRLPVFNSLSRKISGELA